MPNRGILTASFLHECGKTFIENKNDYNNYANIGAYEILCCYEASEDMGEYLDAIHCINYQMLPLEWNNEHVRKKAL